MTEKHAVGDATRIYALFDLETGEPVYVGKTIQKLIDRLRAHKRSAKRGDQKPLYRWIRKHGGAGIRWIETVPKGEDWKARERYWINELRSNGKKCFNLTDGGEGLAGHKFTDEHRKKIAESVSRGSRVACEQCGESVWRKPRDLAARDRHFCSRGCYQQWQIGKKKKNERGLMGVAGRRAAIIAAARRRNNA